MEAFHTLVFLTCYANAILQALSLFPAFWTRGITNQENPSQLIKSITTVMGLIQRSPSTIDPSPFLRALQLFMSSNNHNFNYNSQQDAHEILNSVLDELSGSSRLVNNLISLTVSQTRSCDICVCSSSTYEDHNILSLSVSKSIQSSLNLFLKDEGSIGENRVFCPVCEKSQDSTIETKISNCGAILILHLKRFNYVNGFLNKDESVVECLPSTISTKNYFLTIPAIVEDGVSLFNGYTLMATINHSGTTESGHYYKLALV